MLSVAAKPPNFNAQAIHGAGLDQLGFRSTANPLRAFGISIGTDMTVVPGRILPPPTLQYGGGGSGPVINEKASWNLRDVRFARGARFDKWIVLVLQDGGRGDFGGSSDPNLKSTVEGLVRMCNKSGMNVSFGPQDPIYVTVQLPPKKASDSVRAEAVGKLHTTLRGLPGKPSFALVMLSNNDKHIYSGLKHVCDVGLGIATVCVQSSMVSKRECLFWYPPLQLFNLDLLPENPQYYGNVALKINMKMGGVKYIHCFYQRYPALINPYSSHSLDARSMQSLNQHKTMLVGIDVTYGVYLSLTYSH